MFRAGNERGCCLACLHLPKLSSREAARRREPAPSPLIVRTVPRDIPPAPYRPSCPGLRGWGHWRNVFSGGIVRRMRHFQGAVEGRDHRPSRVSGQAVAGCAFRPIGAGASCRRFLCDLKADVLENKLLHVPMDVQFLERQFELLLLGVERDLSAEHSIGKADTAMSRWVIAAGLKLIVVLIDSTWMRRSLASGSRATASHASRARAGRSRQRQSKWAGSTRRCTRTALVTAPFLFGTIPAAARSTRGPVKAVPCSSSTLPRATGSPLEGLGRN